MALKIMPESTDLGDYEVVKRSAFFPDKDTASHELEPDMAGIFGEESDMTMLFDYGGNGTVSFSRGCLDALGDPKYILTLIHTEKRLLLLQAQEEADIRDNRPRGIRVEKNEDGAWVMDSCISLLSKVADLMAWHPGGGTKMLFEGKLYEGRVVFLLSDAIMFTSGSADELTEYLINNMAGMTGGR